MDAAQLSVTRRTNVWIHHGTRRNYHPLFLGEADNQPGNGYGTTSLNCALVRRGSQQTSSKWDPTRNWMPTNIRSTLRGPSRSAGAAAEPQLLKVYARSEICGPARTVETTCA